MPSSRRAALSGFPPAEGLHCSSTSVRIALAFDGVRLSEAMTFGLGSGLGCFYVEAEGSSPSRALNGRAPDLEGAFYRHVGQPLAWAGRWDPEGMAAALAHGRPVLAQTDLFHLPYYQPPVHFPGHGVVVVGVDVDAGKAWIADQGFPEVQEVELECLRRAMAVVAPPLLPSTFRWAAAPRVPEPALASAQTLASALRRTVRIMAGEEEPGQGLPALARLAGELPSWAELPDALWCARFAYQSIEKRGTGGGAFRLLYAAFLREAQERWRVADAGHAARLYDEAANGWRALAASFKEVFLSADRALFANCARRAQGLLSTESSALEALQAVADGL